MPLKHLRKIIVNNQLGHEVTDLLVVYHESNKSLNNWHNLGAVNVETLKNVLWSRGTPFSTILPFSTTEENAGHVCFGQNVGFWQVYFSIDESGKKYKLFKNDCKLALSQECHEQDLKIELVYGGDKKCSDVMVKFQICTLKAEFKTIEGEPLSRGIKVWIRNQTKKQVIVSSFAITEGSGSKVAPMTSRREVSFEEKDLKPDAAMASKDIPYDCFDRKHYIELFLISDGNCYEIQENRQRQVAVTLSDLDYGKTVDVDLITKQTNPQDVFVKIKTCKEEKCFKAEMTGSVSDRKYEVSKAVYKLRSLSFEDEALELIEKFEEIATDIGKEGLFVDEEYHDIDLDSILFHCPEFDSKQEEVTMEGRKYKITGDVMNSLDGFRCAVVALDQFKVARKEIDESLLDLDRLLQTLNEAETKPERNCIRQDSKIVRFMCMTDALCNVLTLTGLDKSGLTFTTSEVGPTDEISICPGKLALALRQELDLWRLCLFSTAEKTEDLESKHFLTYNESATRLEEIFIHVKLKLIDDLRRIANELHTQNKNVNISMLTSCSIGIVGAVLTTVGIVIAPFTAGASLPLVVAGVSVGAASGAVGVGTTIADGVLTGKFLQSTISLARNYVHIHDQLSSLRSLLMEEQSCIEHPLTGSGGNYFKVKNIADTASSAVANVGLTVAKTGVQVAKTAAFRVGSVALGLVFDLTGLVVRSVNLSRGALSELGCKLEAEASLLEVECIEENNYHHLLSKCDDDYDDYDDNEEDDAISYDDDDDASMKNENVGKVSDEIKERIIQSFISKTL